jgi:hypothetical protein
MKGGDVNKKYCGHESGKGEGKLRIVVDLNEFWRRGTVLSSLPSSHSTAFPFLHEAVVSGMCLVD